MDFFDASFVVDLESHRDAELMLAYFNGVDSYTKLQILYLHSNGMKFEKFTLGK